MTKSSTTHSDAIFNDELEKSLRRYKRDPISLFLSAVSAGLEIGFSLLVMAALYTQLVGSISIEVLYVIMAFGYPVGFILVIVGDSDLFTEHTTMAAFPFLNGDTSLLQLMKTWSVILSGNLIGGFIFSGLLTALVGHIGTIDASSIVAIADKVLATSAFPMFISAVFAGWLMGLVSWLVTSSRETISQIVIVIIITTVIGIAGLHHSIVGSIEVFTGLLLSADITLRDYLSFQTLAILGNVVGGVLFVAVMKMSQTHNVRSKRLLSD